MTGHKNCEEFRRRPFLPTVLLLRRSGQDASSGSRPDSEATALSVCFLHLCNVKYFCLECRMLKGGGIMRLNFAGALVAAALILACGCAARDVGPINTVGSEAPPPTPKFITDGGDDGSTVMALAFSGGGMRASAFSFGVLTALDDIVVDEIPYRRS